MTTKGDCFPAALTCARTLVEEGADRVLLCHGRPLGQGGNALGLRYWHAWVEVKAHGEWVVVDISNSKRASLPRPRYYALGSIPAPGERVRRYSLRDAAALMAAEGHYGPWPEGAAAVDEAAS